MTTIAERLEMWGFADPDDVGESEYRAIYDTIADGLTSQDEDDPDASPSELADAMLQSFIASAQAMRKQLRKVTK